MHEAPAWFVHWIRLGMRLASLTEGPNPGRMIVAVSAPTEVLAVPAVAFGFVRGAYLRCPTNEATPVELSGLSKGDWFSFCAGNLVRTARFIGFDARGVARTSNGHFQPDKLRNVRRLPEWAEPEQAKSAHVADVIHEAFIRQLLRSADPVEFATAWTTQLLLLGSQSRIQAELDVEIAAAEEGAERAALREIVRPLDEDTPLGCQSMLLSARVEEPVWQTRATPPRVTILRGAYATSRWLPEMTGNCVVSVLGRSEDGMDAAVAALLQSRAYGDPMEADELGWSPPTGCELLAFRGSA